MEMQLDTHTSILLSIDLIGTVLGASAVISLLYYTVKSRYSGNLRTLFLTTAIGISLQVFGLVWTVLFSRLALLGKGVFPTGFDLHHLFMTLGMIFFIYAAKLYTDIYKVFGPAKKG